MTVNRDEKKWLSELEGHRGWTDSKGDPKKLREWVAKSNEVKGTGYRVSEANGVSDYAWNPGKFDPKKSPSGAYNWLADFSGVGGNLERAADLVRQRLSLPTLYIAEAIVEYWRDEINVLKEGDGLLVLSDEYFRLITTFERYLAVNEGLLSVSVVAERFDITQELVKETYKSDNALRIITDEIVLDLEMASIDAGWVSKLISDGSNVVSMTEVAERLGLLGGGLSLQQETAVEVARNVSGILAGKFPEFNINPEGDSLNVGNEAEVIRAHIRLAEAARDRWEENQQKYAEQRSKQEDDYEQVELELMDQEGSSDVSEIELVDQALQADFLQRYIKSFTRSMRG
jgi:hypothetical protein